jgi:hypothetical protein
VVAVSSPAAFREELLRVPPSERDAWVDRQFGLGELPADGPLPRGCVPYLPASVDVILRMIEAANVRADDVSIDIGSGVGRASMLMHCLTGAPAIGIEIQPALAHASRELVQRMRGDRVSVIEGDAAELAQYMTIGSVFLLYCPFSGERLERVLDDLEPIARTRTIRVCTIDLPLPARSWLEPVLLADDLHVYRSI